LTDLSKDWYFSIVDFLVNSSLQYGQFCVIHNIYPIFFEPFHEALRMEQMPAIGDPHHIFTLNRAQADHAIAIPFISLVIFFVHEIIGRKLFLFVDISA
jgi:uncharacterized membrane protein